MIYDNEFNNNDFLDNIDVELNHFQDVYPNLNCKENSKYYNIDNYNKSTSNNNSDLKIFHQNIRSLNANYDYILGLFNSLNVQFDILCFSESWLTTHSSKYYEFDNYNSFHSLRTADTFISHGGVSIYISNKIIGNKIDNCTIMNRNIESLFLNLYKDDKHFFLGLIYRPPNSNCNIFIDKLNEIISSLKLSNSKECIICGDFNLNLLNYSNCNNTLKFINLMNASSFIPVISKPSRITDNSATLIDNIYINQPSQFLSGLLTCDFSDHLPLFLHLGNFFVNPNNDNIEHEIKYRLINDVSLNDLGNYLSQYDFSTILESNCVNTATSLFDEVINNAYTKFCPIITKKIKLKDIKKPWITKNIVNLIKRRSNLFVLYNLNKISKLSLTRYRNFVTNKIRLAKKEYYERKFEEYKKNIRETWKIINDVIRNKSKSKFSIKKLIVDDEVFENPKDVANILNNHFCNVGSDIAKSFKSNFNDHKRYLGTNNIQSLFLCPVLPQDIKSIILNLKTSKSTIDHYGSEFLIF